MTMLSKERVAQAIARFDDTGSMEIYDILVGCLALFERGIITLT